MLRFFAAGGGICLSGKRPERTVPQIGWRAMVDYHVNIFSSVEDEGYIADIPDLPHCSAFGETAEQALARF